MADTCEAAVFSAEGRTAWECNRTDTAVYYTPEGDEVVLCPECAERNERRFSGV